MQNLKEFKEETLKKLKVIEKENFIFKKRRLYFIPIGTAKVIADINKKEVREFLIKNLLVYPSWKKLILTFLIYLRLFKKININFPKNFDLGRFGARTKLFDFEKKKIYTITHKFRDYFARKEVKNLLNCPKIIKKKRNFFIEELIFPYNNLKKEDIIPLFKILIRYYKRRIDKNNLEVKIHGDLWKGNLIKKGGRIYFLDFDGYQKAIFTQDLIHFFSREYLYSGKINKKTLGKVSKLFIEEFRLTKKEFFKIIKQNIDLLNNNANEKNKKAFHKILKIVSTS